MLWRPQITNSQWTIVKVSQDWTLMQCTQETECKHLQQTSKEIHRYLKTGTEEKLPKVVYQVLTFGLLILEVLSTELHRHLFHNLVGSWRRLASNRQDQFHMIQIEIQIIKVPQTAEVVQSPVLHWLQADLFSEKVKAPSSVNKSASRRSRLFVRWGITSTVSNMNQQDLEPTVKAKTNFPI